MENLGVTLFGDSYRRRNVLVTGHTGFKGSWLTLWLEELGARVSGISVDVPSSVNHWDLLDLKCVDHREDIRDLNKIRTLIRASRPEIVFHLAAQPLVRRSYVDPIETWSTNVLGTANVLEACREASDIKAIVVITTDKVYANRESNQAYKEDDRLGGHDAYSASKAACEILVQSYRAAFFNPLKQTLLASARAGNVIGGGDWSEDRLVPDLVKAVTSSHALTIRSPMAIRPWQHVLECLSGYLLLGQRLLEGSTKHAAAWNFGPAPNDHRTVAELLSLLQRHWPKLQWTTSVESQPHEATLLHLDQTKTRNLLDWSPQWTVEQAVQATAEWYRRYHEAQTVESRNQLAQYIRAAQSCGAVWVDA